MCGDLQQTQHLETLPAIGCKTGELSAREVGGGVKLAAMMPIRASRASTGRSSSTGSENACPNGTVHRLQTGAPRPPMRPSGAGSAGALGGLNDITNSFTNAPQVSRALAKQHLEPLTVAERAAPIGPTVGERRPSFAKPQRAGGDQPITNAANATAMLANPAATQPAVVAAVGPAPVTEDDSSKAKVVDEPLQDVQDCMEYAPQIFAQLLSEEATFLPLANYMEAQTDINGKMRSILIDWLVEVHSKHRLRPETMFLAVNLIDRYLSHVQVMRRRLQLVGVVAMFTAAKYEEIHPPKAQDFVYITDNAYSREEILNLECHMLTILGFQVVVPTAAHFVEPLARVNECDEYHRQLVYYILESSLLDVRMIRYLPSILVCASICLSNQIKGRQHVWPANMANESQHPESQLQDCMADLKALLDAAPSSTLQAMRKKYSSAAHLAVAKRLEEDRTDSVSC
eukprot:gnl/TRDRNA2_/TRDRNA2_180571_c0_seq1.p1 gnl/TRDRNA2_/TRDRNA2_180571_c0~~gnl/TRDRNA2_/TRDRNA2_180571_c0_seq1.p1  ORF type:complete len:482 (+),score=97.96 gnl/TRDRNA2_/TRDRNA2_180571_c0_seq1:75-1448(+)